MNVDRVEQELTALWRQASSEDRAVARACSLNLIVACSGPEDVIDATGVVAKFAEIHPGRVLLVAPGYGGSLDAFVSTHCHLGPGGRQICCEQVTLEVPHGENDNVSGTLLQLLVADVPVYTWWRRTLGGDDPWLGPLAEMSDRLVVYSANSSDPRRALVRLAQLAWTKDRGPKVGDLTWVRLNGWREMVASLFDVPAAADTLSRLTRLHVSGGGATTRRGATAASAYLAGWITSRLGWRPSGRPGIWTRPDGGEVSIELEPDPRLDWGRLGFVHLESSHEGIVAYFNADRSAPDKRSVRLTVGCGSGSPIPRIEKLNAIEEHVLLAGEIERSGEDPVYVAGLRDAARIVGEE